MNQFFTDKNKKYFIFHISSSEVIGSIVSFNQIKQKPNIDFSISEEILFNKDFNSEEFYNSTSKALDSVSEALSNYLNIMGINITHIFVFLTSPVAKKNVFTLVDERMNPFLVSEAYLENIIEKGGKVAENEVLLKADIISVKANDYDVDLSDVVDKKISKLEISLMDSFINKKDEKRIDGVLKKNFPFLNTTFSAFLPSFFSQINKIYNTSNDFSFLDFSGEYMEFGLYVDNQVKVVSQLPFGINKILRILVEENIIKDLKEARYIFNLYIAGSLDIDIAKKIDNIIFSESKKIKEFLKKNMKEVDDFEIPRKTFIFSPFGMRKIIKELNIFKNIEFVDKNVLKYFVDSSDEENFNNFIAIESEFIFDF